MIKRKKGPLQNKTRLKESSIQNKYKKRYSLLFFRKTLAVNKEAITKTQAIYSQNIFPSDP